MILILHEYFQEQCISGICAQAGGSTFANFCKGGEMIVLLDRARPEPLFVIDRAQHAISSPITAAATLVSSRVPVAIDTRPSASSGHHSSLSNAALCVSDGPELHPPPRGSLSRFATPNASYSSEFLTPQHELSTVLTRCSRASKRAYTHVERSTSTTGALWNLRLCRSPAAEISSRSGNLLFPRSPQHDPHTHRSAFATRIAWSQPFAKKRTTPPAILD
jgi:hypothetical protein